MWVDRQTDALIAILRASTGGDIIIPMPVFMRRCCHHMALPSSCREKTQVVWRMQTKRQNGCQPPNQASGLALRVSRSAATVHTYRRHLLLLLSLRMILFFTFPWRVEWRVLISVHARFILQLQQSGILCFHSSQTLNNFQEHLKTHVFWSVFNDP